MELSQSRQDKALLIAQLNSHPGFLVLKEWMTLQMEALRNELENANNPNLQHTQGQVFTYRNIFNYIAEKTKEAK